MVILPHQKLLRLKERVGLAGKGHQLLVIQESHRYWMQQARNRRGEMVLYGSHLWRQIISEILTLFLSFSGFFHFYVLLS